MEILLLVKSPSAFTVFIIGVKLGVSLASRLRLTPTLPSIRSTVGSTWAMLVKVFAVSAMSILSSLALTFNPFNEG